MSAAYSNIHRAFLQSMSLRGAVKEEDALKILVHIYSRYQPGEASPTQESVKSVVKEINNRILRYEQQIFRFDYDLTRSVYYVFANGTQCQKCGDKLHKSCMEKYIKRMKKCPACDQEWTQIN